MDNITFKQIVILDYTGLQKFALDKLQAISEQRIIAYNDIPKDDADIISRIQHADCVFVSWNTRITAAVLSQCHKLKYIGMCCSLIDFDSANVDVRFAMEKGITVKGVRDYGDEGVGEFIITELIQLLKGLGKHQWREEPVELTNKKVGIIGIGTTGRLTAHRLQAFGAKTYYYSRNRKPDAENEGIEYMPLNELLYHCDIISFHLPRGTKILNAEHFKILGNNKIIINTSLGLCFEKEDFKKWIDIKENYAIFDIVAFGEHKAELSQNDNIIYSEATSGWTKEAKERLSYKVLENLEEYAREAQKEACISI